MSTALSGSQLVINNEVLPYQPNSLKFNIGRPERKVDPQVVGNNATENVASEDFSTSKGMIMFDLKSTSENNEIVDTLIRNFDANVVKIIFPNASSVVFEKGVIINKPEIDTGSDGIISVEMEAEVGVFG